MYKKAIEYYQEPFIKPIKYSRYNGPVQETRTVEEHEDIKEKYIKSHKSFTNHPDNNEKILDMKCEIKQHINMSNPKCWGPAFWFTLHNGASKYPISASPITLDRMKGYIIGIPVMLPCVACKTHATDYIEKNRHKLDEICSGRYNLFKFFVDFHNNVNKRTNKQIFSLDEAYKMYNGVAKVSILKYE